MKVRRRRRRRRRRLVLGRGFEFFPFCNERLFSWALEALRSLGFSLLVGRTQFFSPSCCLSTRRRRPPLAPSPFVAPPPPSLVSPVATSRCGAATTEGLRRSPWRPPWDPSPSRYRKPEISPPFFFFVLLVLTVGSILLLRAPTRQMYHKHAPKTCRNFVELARRKYYDNVVFHRIIKVRSHFPSMLPSRLARRFSTPAPLGERCSLSGGVDAGFHRARWGS